MSNVDFLVENLGAQELNSAVALNQVYDTFVGIWSLSDTGSDAPENVVFLPYKNKNSDGHIGNTDARLQVDDADIAPGGKYRSIVKLFLRYSNQKASDPWVMATGWLAAPDLVVTAGQSAYDWSYTMGRLTQVKAYVGYNGKASIGDPNVQFKQGSRVATTAEWLRSKGVRAYDIAFIKLQQPFSGVIPIKFEDTPKSGLTSLGVVGYAGDLVDKYTGEKGAHMYEVFSDTNWNLEDSEYTMLEYPIDPYGGNSGSPILRRDDLVSIGTHVYGGYPSSASVIGLLGNPYQNYIAAFSVEPTASGRNGLETSTAITYVRVNTIVPKQEMPQQNQGPSSHNDLSQNGSSQNSFSQNSFSRNSFSRTGFSQNGYSQNGFTQKGSQALPLAQDDEFFEILKVGIKLSAPTLSNILEVHSPIVLGSVGSAVGALAGAVLAAAGKFSSFSSSLVHDFRQGLPYDGIVERAILGEAAFSVVMSMKRRRLEEEGIFANMAAVVKQLSPATKRVAPYIMDTLTAPALRIALDALHNRADNSAARYSSAGSQGTPFAQSFTPSGTALDGDAETFVKRLSALSVDHDDSIDRIIQIGFREAGPVLTAVASEGLQYLASSLPEFAVSGGNGAASHNPHIDGLPERAMLGEAALQALMKVPKNRLDEGTFDIMAKSVARIGNVVLRSAHGLIEDIGFLTKAIITVPVPSSGDGAPGSQSLASRRDKGMSFVNLETEVLDFYRGLETKPLPQVLE